MEASWWEQLNRLGRKRRITRSSLRQARALGTEGEWLTLSKRHSVLARINRWPVFFADVRQSSSLFSISDWQHQQPAGEFAAQHIGPANSSLDSICL